jgi:hypothetical protein
LHSQKKQNGWGIFETISFLSDWPGMLRHGEVEFSRKEAAAGDFFKPKGEMTMPYVFQSRFSVCGACPLRSLSSSL